MNIISRISQTMKLSLGTHSVRRNRDSIRDDPWQISQFMGWGLVNIHVWKLYLLTANNGIVTILNFTWALCSWKRAMIKNHLTSHVLGFWEMACCKESPLRRRVTWGSQTPSLFAYDKTRHTLSTSHSVFHKWLKYLCPQNSWDKMPFDLTMIKFRSP